MLSLHRAWRWGRVLLAPEAACRPFSPSLESQASSRPVPARTVAPPAPAPPPVTSPVPRKCRDSVPRLPTRPSTVLPAFLVSAAPRFCDPSLRLASFLSASATLTGHTLVQAVVPGENSGVCPSSSLPSFQLSPSCPGPGALAASSLCPSPAWAPGWSHPPALGSSLPVLLLRSPGKVLLASTLGLCTPALPQALSWSGGQASLAGFTRSTLSPAQGLEFPLFLLPSFPPSLHSRLHPPLWLSPVSLQTCVLSTPLPSSLV